MISSLFAMLMAVLKLDTHFQHLTQIGSSFSVYTLFIHVEKDTLVADLMPYQNRSMDYVLIWSYIVNDPGFVNASIALLQLLESFV